MSTPTPEISDRDFALEMLEWAIDAALEVCADHWMAKSRLENLRSNYCTVGYAEPGCTDPEGGVIVLGNWNDVTEWRDGELHRIDQTMRQVVRIFEALGFEIEWEDCWIACDDCCKLVRTEPDSYGWTPSFVRDDCGHTVCIDCLEEDASSYFEELEESGKGNSISRLHPSDHGYVEVMGDFESGWHRGQDASPEKISNLLNDAGFERIIINLDSKGQFDIRFSVWMHEEEANADGGMGLIRAKRVLETGETDGPSNADALEAALRESSRQADELRKSGATGIVYSKVSPEGVTTREVSEQEWIEGVKD